jgi:hypothetical protein
MLKGRSDCGNRMEKRKYVQEEVVQKDMITGFLFYFLLLLLFLCCLKALSSDKVL